MVRCIDSSRCDQFQLLWVGRISKKTQKTILLFNF